MKMMNCDERWPGARLEPCDRIRLSKNYRGLPRSGWTHFGVAMFKSSLNRLLTRAAQNVVTGTQARRPVLRGDLNLKEVGKGRATRLVTFSPLKLWPKSTSTATVREIWPQLASQAASLPRGAGSQYHAGGPKPA